MKKTVMMSVAAVVTLVVQLAGIGPATAVEPAAAAKASVATEGSANPTSVQGYWCDQSGVGSSKAYATCYNQTDQARYAHFHVDCWAWGDADTDQTKWVGPWGSVSFYHYCWSSVSSIEAYFY
jgi:hypothetical protein